MVVVEAQSRTKLKEWGTSRGIRIPKSYCEYATISLNSDVIMTVGHDEEGKFITLRPASEHRSYGDVPMLSMDDLFAGYSGDYVPAEPDWGEDVGAEVVA